MILFDANVLVELSRLETSETKERIQGLLSELSISKTVIGIPAPAWAEYLCGSDASASVFSTAFRSRAYVQILPFDDISAYEAALLHQEIVGATGTKKGRSTLAWQQVKIDRQILAIARQYRVSAIYTNDDDMIADAQILKIPCFRPHEVQLKPVQRILDLHAAPEGSQVRRDPGER
ncbi:type II toxin-antitoxin system VapC family toxin [Massilia sp. CCM 9210]|uniref:type II toxin-antitoxin system VapC family toxin n=1 Tax=Massilia scottii TaxID=3057166 RepID=UPI002796DE3E|nr:type II toxin-antitoxin system VapC family toxin [Massilia sp. CCM 9210]MDQ1815744.1 type II toxin-antitoxin system VapC family toxin [Massilia sp. CCM 9210]